MTDAISHRFNEHCLIVKSDFACTTRCIVHGEEIVTIDTNNMHAVADSTAGDTVAGVLLTRWRRDCIAVVTTEENHRTFQCTAEVEGGVRVT